MLPCSILDSRPFLFLDHTLSRTWVGFGGFVPYRGFPCTLYDFLGYYIITKNLCGGYVIVKQINRYFF